MFEIYSVGKSHWIWISGTDSFDEPDEFIELVKVYQSHLSGKIYKVSDDMQYAIDNDPLKLIFQWDSCFGITVVVPYKTKIDEVRTILQGLCDKLNQNTKKLTDT